MYKKRIIFLTGTRADYGKIKNLIQEVQKLNKFKAYLFVTGMHNLKEFGETHIEISLDKIQNTYKFKNQKFNEPMDSVFLNTFKGFKKYIKKIRPDLIVIHGDRTEALACASVGCLNNYKVAHIEGGEISCTIDETLRHAISKLSNIHFVTNQIAKRRLIQLGELKNKIHVIGSPDVDVILKKNLPKLDIVKNRYNITFHKYAIGIFHPVTSELHQLQDQIDIFVKSLIKSNNNYVIISPNNDHGAKKIFTKYKKIKSPKIRILPSMRFEYYLTLLKNSDFIIGNSSSGIMEAPYFGIPTINLGTRQKNRTNISSIINISINIDLILSNINQLNNKKQKPKKIINTFGDGNSTKRFINILSNKSFWETSNQKYFQDLKKINEYQKKTILHKNKLSNYF